MNVRDGGDGPNLVGVQDCESGSSLTNTEKTTTTTTMEGLNIDIKQLENLLKDPTEDRESDDEFDKPSNAPTAKLGPGSIGPVKKKSDDKTPAAHSVYEKKAASKDIWDADEVEEGAEFDTNDDPRPQPDYEIVYKQSLSAEELFLQMGNKTAATASCEDMLVKIKLPGVEKLSEIDVEVFEKFLDCRTANYRLGLHLPHPVNKDITSAKWDPKDHVLSVTMRMCRDFDILNF